MASMANLPSVFREVGVRGLPVRCTAAHEAAFSERHYRARGATSRAKSLAARTRQHVTVSGVVPTHQVGLDGLLTEQHRHWIVDVGGRDVPVRIQASRAPR